MKCLKVQKQLVVSVRNILGLPNTQSVTIPTCQNNNLNNNSNSNKNNGQAKWANRIATQPQPMIVG